MSRREFPSTLSRSARGPDEYIEVTHPHPEDRVFERRFNQIVPVRIALNFQNPTKRYLDTHKSDIEMVDLTDKTVENSMMARMKIFHFGHLPRYLYFVAHECIRLYNGVHHGGKAVARYLDVATN